MKQAKFHQKLWMPIALLVLLTPLLMNQILNAISPPATMALAYTPGQAEEQIALPQMLPMRLNRTAMQVYHQALPQGLYQSRYINTLAESNEGLVPYIPRLFDLDNYTQTRQETRTIAGQPYVRTQLRRKFSPHNFVSYHQFQVGTTQTDSYAKAKLYQIPAAFRGAQVFTLTIWQSRCQQADCERESQQIEQLLAEGSS
ncbi:MAG: hypothetical protein LAT65_15840 [Saccharospirillum sp.]|nr:hypothetical protein [Saccharospirillum sp.]